MPNMEAKLWFWTTIALSLAVILAVLILPPWSPLSLTNNEASGRDPVVQVPPRADSSLTFSPSPSPTPAAESPDLLQQSLSTAKAETVLTGLPAQIRKTTGSVIQPSIPTQKADPAPQVAATVITTSAPRSTLSSIPSPTLTPLPVALPTPEPVTTATPPSTASATSAPEPFIPVGLEGVTELAEAASLTTIELVAATRHPVWKVRWDAVNELGLRKDPDGIAALAERALHDDNSHPRMRSLWAISAID